MTEDQDIHILIAEDNDVSRQMMAGILESHGYKIIHARDGTEAVTAINDDTYDIALALVDVRMSPMGGLEFVKYLITNAIDLPVMIVTGDTASNILMEASALGVKRLIQKPIEPDRLLKNVEQILKRFRNIHVKPIVEAAYKTALSRDELLQKTLDLAEKNVRTHKGGPYAAIIADKEGHILGQGAQGAVSRSDPVAHAEVMAIRHATETLASSDLSGCTLYCSSEPTAVGKALIKSVGIGHVYYGLSHDDVRSLTSRAGVPSHHAVEPSYEQIHKDAALEMFKKMS